MQKRETNAFGEMMRVARGWLAGRDPQKLAAKAGATFCGDAFRLQSLGQELRVRYPAYEIDPEIEGWRQLVLLHYLNLADGAPLCGRLIAFGELRDGMVRGGDFDRRCEAALRELGTHGEAELRMRFEALGARFIESNADLCAEFAFLPRYPMTLKLWFADEDFPASGRLMLDVSADHYLTIEDAVTAGTLLLEAINSK